MKSCMHRILSLAVLVSLFGTTNVNALLHEDNPLSPGNSSEPAAQAMPFAGKFSSDKLTLELNYDEKQQAYTGWLTMGANRYAIGGIDDNGTLTGKFVANGDPFDFKATLAGDEISLQSGGASYSLKRTLPDAANPANAGGQIPGQNPSPAQPNNGTATGGVGIAFEPTQDGHLVVRGILPGGPADKAKLKPGGTLVAIDGKEVAGWQPEQVRAALAGPIGSQVTVTIETDTEVMDVILNRADISRGNALQSDPGPVPQPNNPNPQPGFPAPPAQPGIPAGMPQAAHARYPAWLTSGMRITMYSSSATLTGVSQVLVPDENGTEWVDANGRKYSVAQNAGAGGAGLMQLDVIEASDQGLLVDARNLLIADPQSGALTTTGAVGYVGTTESLGDYWVNPAKLASMQEGVQGGVVVKRLPYPLNGKTYNAISFTNKQQNGFQRNTFDLETGLCLVTTMSSIGAPQMTPGADGKSQMGAGNTMIGYGQLADVREIKLPWANDAMPDWMSNGHTIRYTGSYATSIPNVPEMPAFKYSMSFEFGQRKTTAVLCKQTNSLDMGQGPQQGTVDRVAGCNVVNPLYIAPATLRSLQPNQLIDEDKVTKTVYAFNGIQGNLAVFTEKREREASQFGYDVNTGVLTVISFEQFQGVGTLKVQLKLESLR